MKKRFHDAQQNLKEYWRTLMHSTQERMSTGARYVMSIITRAHKDNWRRKEHKKPSKD